MYIRVKDFHEKALEICGDVHGGVDVVELGALAVALRERLESGVHSKVVFCHNDLQASAWCLSLLSLPSMVVLNAACS